MNDARPYASLSSGLLARKGSAKPAMRPQGFGGLEDLGWNDMGDGRPAPVPEHVPSSIAALTPAPKIQRTNPGDAHLPGYGGEFEEAEGGDGAEACEEEVCEEAEEIAPEFRQPEAEEFAPQAAGFFAPEAVEPEADEAEAIAPPAYPVEAIEPAYEPEAIEPEAYEPEAVEPAYEPEAVEPAREPEAIEPAYEPEAIEPEVYEPEPVAPEPVETFAAPPVVAQQRAILEQLEAEPEEHEAPVPSRVKRSARADVVPLPKRAAAGERRKAAFTLRLDAERHLRLRLACAVTRHSAQQIVARALDEALASIPEIESLASQVPVKPGRAGKIN